MGFPIALEIPQNHFNYWRECCGRAEECCGMFEECCGMVEDWMDFNNFELDNSSVYELIVDYNNGKEGQEYVVKKIKKLKIS